MILVQGQDIKEIQRSELDNRGHQGNQGREAPESLLFGQIRILFSNLGFPSLICPGVCLRVTSPWVGQPFKPYGFRIHHYNHLEEPPCPQGGMDDDEGRQ